MIRGELIRKYDVPVPRYTSYPTVPAWDVVNFSIRQWVSAVERTFDETNESKGLSLYIHLPFCESLCTYCACNTRITTNHGVEEKYIQSILTEWELYRYIFGKTPVIRELHLGGGTPTFFNPANLKKLLTSLLSTTILHPEYEFSFEGHPNNTTKEHLQVLFDCGFRRASYGVQDLDEKVQKAINRIQPVENLEKVVALSRAIGFSSISFDLIYGLPYQSLETITSTFKQVIKLRPDRIAFYSYAHVPWVKPGQRGYEDANLPSDVAKRALYEAGKTILKQEGYHDIGMDHFALSTDTLYKASVEGKLHRNFMGYTTSQTDLLIGLGASAISDAKYAFAQNVKKVEDYEHLVLNNKLALNKGHIQTEEDLLIKQCILDITCRGEVETIAPLINKQDRLLKELREMEQEEILVLTKSGLKVTALGKTFIRNICYAFDTRQNKTNSNNKTFSKSI
ncbi:MAG TPA: oxygen-independent coproporphyrinogen III oxidase [Cyclobacteriaceae bacterium]